MTQKVRKAKPRVMILTPVYNEEAGLPEFERAVTRLMADRPDATLEVLFVDDGSEDGSWARIEEICGRDPRFQGLRLSRNFGSHVALSAGLAHSRADAVVVLACDLQDPPEVIGAFLDRWRAGADIVWGHRRTRSDAWWRVAVSKVFSVLLARYAMPRGSRFATGSFLLADRKVVECYNQFKESNRVTFALVAWTGFSQAVVEYDRGKRTAGKSGWTIGRMIRTMYDAFISFSPAPVRLITLLGVTVSGLTIPLAGYVVYEWLSGDPLAGWTSIMLAVSVFFGIQFLLMGLVGEYLHRIQAEALNRPLYFVSDQSGFGRQGEGDGDGKTGSGSARAE